MRKLQKGDVVAVIIYDWINLICAYPVDNPDSPVIEIKFSRLVVEDGQMKIEGAQGSDLIYMSLAKIPNARWVVDEVVY